ncbi:MAG: tetrahydromethanopterin C1 transfer protein, partial [Gammaproteobacteria bacterium]
MSAPPLLIVATSARVLAAAAAAAGHAGKLYAIDLFADRDTRTLTTCAQRLAPTEGWAMPHAPLLAAVDMLVAHCPRPPPLVYGSGFEAAPALLRELATRVPVFGCDASVLATLGDMPALVARCGAHADVAFPPTRRQPPRSP